jgi:hypothetical protein
MPPNVTSPVDDRSDSDDVLATPTLYLPEGIDKGGFLILPMHDELGRRYNLSVYLKPCLARTVYALYDAIQEDRRIVPEARGWRRADKLARLIELRFGWPILPQTVRGYLTNLQKSIRKAERLRGGLATEVPVVIERQRGVGARFYSLDLNILDGTDD